MVAVEDAAAPSGGVAREPERGARSPGSTTSSREKRKVRFEAGAGPSPAFSVVSVTAT